MAASAVNSAFTNGATLNDPPTSSVEDPKKEIPVKFWPPKVKSHR